VTALRVDHVVVGAGSAGAALAAGLSADPAVTVAVLEAGPDHPAADTPPAVAGPDFLAALDEPGRVWDGLLARRSAGQAPRLYARGRGVGGSSAVNGMLAIEGLPDDYDRWAELGATGWGWSHMETLLARVALPRRRVRETELNAVDRALRAAATGLGHPIVDRYDGPGTEGWAPARLTVSDDGRRVSTNDAYLEPARGRPNVSIRGDAPVDRVLLEGRRAVGVRLHDGTEVEAGCVWLSCGAIHSPTLLLRSGVDRPGIGHNLKDHPSAPVLLRLRPDFVVQPGQWPAIGGVLRWSSGHAEADLQLVALGRLPGPEGERTALLLVALMEVQGSGRVSLRSDDPGGRPRIEFDLLADQHDRARLRLGLRHVLSIVDQPAVRAIVEEVVLDGAGSPDALVADDDALDQWLVAGVGDYVHAAGSCRMGAPDDPLAVVDPQLRVIGYERLCVADASVMPDLPRANTNLTAVAIGERAAELARGE
jgi:choline dehydrogenase/5-(hydroxymethyl)furfural/furfural oxidase